MSNLSTKDRAKLAASDFGDPDRKLFPIIDQNDVDSAAHLIGKAKDPEAVKARVIAIAKRKGLKIPDAWQSDAAKHAHTPAGTSNAAQFGVDDLVLRTGKVWEAGEYPDKLYAMTPEEVMAAAIDFTPVPVNSGHPLVTSPLDGLLGELRSIDLADDGVSVIGTVAFPRWLDDLLTERYGDAERPVSMEWNRETKRPQAISLVDDPRISGAALMAAFAKRHDTAAGQSVIQRIHDHAASNGAICAQGNVARMHSRHEVAALQDIHDTAVTHGAQCNAQGAGLAMGPALYSGTTPTPARRGPMSWLTDFFKLAKEAPEGFDAEALFSGGSAVATAGTTPAASVTPAPATLPDTEKDALKLELARERAKGILRDAEAFADRMIEKEERAVPSERDAIIAAFCQAAQDDIHFGPVTFANGTQGNRLGVLTAAYAARPAHILTADQVRGDIRAVLYNRTETPNPNDPKPPTAERKAELLSKTTFGRSVLADRNGAH